MATESVHGARAKPAHLVGLKHPYLYENICAKNTREATMRFALWAAQCRHLTVERIQAFLGCSRGSAYRYLADFKAANGEEWT